MTSRNRLKTFRLQKLIVCQNSISEISSRFGTPTRFFFIFICNGTDLAEVLKLSTERGDVGTLPYPSSILTGAFPISSSAHYSLKPRTLWHFVHFPVAFFNRAHFCNVCRHRSLFSNPVAVLRNASKGKYCVYYL